MHIMKIYRVLNHSNFNIILEREQINFVRFCSTIDSGALNAARKRFGISVDGNKVNLSLTGSLLNVETNSVSSLNNIDSKILPDARANGRQESNLTPPTDDDNDPAINAWKDSGYVEYITNQREKGWKT